MGGRRHIFEATQLGFEYTLYSTKTQGGKDRALARLFLTVIDTSREGVKKLRQSKPVYEFLCEIFDDFFSTENGKDFY